MEYVNSTRVLLLKSVLHSSVIVRAAFRHQPDSGKHTEFGSLAEFAQSCPGVEVLIRDVHESRGTVCDQTVSCDNTKSPAEVKNAGGVSFAESILARDAARRRTTAFDIAVYLSLRSPSNHQPK